MVDGVAVAVGGAVVGGFRVVVDGAWEAGGWAVTPGLPRRRR
ncbi:hypothetical protein [Actinoplanes sp. TBRC 11911]|nr:hypothetical protein [Actinoplanes sp. TBRC 11911]